MSTNRKPLTILNLADLPSKSKPQQHSLLPIGLTREPMQPSEAGQPAAELVSLGYSADTAINQANQIKEADKAKARLMTELSEPNAVNKTSLGPVHTLQLLDKATPSLTTDVGIQSNQLDQRGLPSIHVANNTQQSTSATAEAFQWDDSQLKAIDTIMRNRFISLIGAAGTGKTTVVREVITRLQAEGIIKPQDYNRSNGEHVSRYNVSFCAFTGKAVEQLRKSVPVDLQKCCETIHSLLEYAPVTQEKLVTEADGSKSYKTSRIFLPRRDEINKLTQSIIIIDEAGMVGIDLWNNLVKALDFHNPNLKIILIGDIYQLPAVIGKSILGYALASSLWKTATLTTIHRQALDNPIIANAHKIKEGQHPVDSLPTDGLRPFRLLDIGSLTQKEREAVRLGTLPNSYFDTKNSEAGFSNNFIKVITRLYNSNLYDPEVDQIIVPQNVGLMGQEMLNIKLAKLFNPNSERRCVHTNYATKFLAVGDKVMFTKNDYDYGILNGMVGTIVDLHLNGNYNNYNLMKIAEEQGTSLENFVGNSTIEELALEDIDKVVKDNAQADYESRQLQASHVVTVEYIPLGFSEPTTIALSTAGEVSSLLHSYAITCHKAQGSEYRTVVIACFSGNSLLLSREWLYTAVTRAREHVLLIYNDKGLKGLTQCLRRQVVKGNTLEDKAKNFTFAEASRLATSLDSQQIPLAVFTEKEIKSWEAGQALASE